jgi:hypothetical protein
LSLPTHPPPHARARNAFGPPETHNSRVFPRLSQVGDALRHPWAAPLLTFITMLILVGLYKVARELEDPLANPPNDLPSSQMQVTH